MFLYHPTGSVCLSYLWNKHPSLPLRQWSILNVMFVYVCFFPCWVVLTHSHETFHAPKEIFLTCLACKKKAVQRHQLGTSPPFPLQQRWCFRIQGIGGEWHVIQAFPNHHSLGDGWEFGPLLNHHSRSWSKPLTSGRRVFGSTLTLLAHQHWLFWAI